MKNTLKTLLICAGMCLSIGAIAASDIDEITLDVMTNDKDLPDAVKGNIELPEHASEIAKEAAEHGMGKANQGRENGPDKGEIAENKEDAKDHKDDVEDHKTDIEDHKSELENHAEDQKDGSGATQDIEDQKDPQR